MAGKPVVPASTGGLMLRGEGCYMCGVEAVEVVPYVLYGPHKQDVCVHIQQRVHLSQQVLQQEYARLKLCGMLTTYGKLQYKLSHITRSKIFCEAQGLNPKQKFYNFGVKFVPFLYNLLHMTHRQEEPL